MHRTETRPARSVLERRAMQFEPGTFKDIAAGVQSIVIALGLLVGGGWTLYTFRTLGSAQKASAELLAIERDQQPGFQLDIDADVKQPDATGPYELLIRLEIRNAGKRSVSLDFSDPSVLVGKLKFVESAGAKLDGQPQKLSVFYISEQGLGPQEERYLRSGDVRHLAYVCYVSTPGLYLIQAQVPYAAVDPDRESHGDLHDRAILALEQRTVSVSNSTANTPNLSSEGKGTGKPAAVSHAKH
jgi:hypothetical protein